jgi:dihydropteroate synthase
MISRLQCGQRSLNLASPVVMGILNVTPDSFSDGGQLYHDRRIDLDALLNRAQAMVDAGAQMLDIGG